MGNDSHNFSLPQAQGLLKGHQIYIKNSPKGYSPLRLQGGLEFMISLALPEGSPVSTGTSLVSLNKFSWMFSVILKQGGSELLSELLKSVMDGFNIG